MPSHSLRIVGATPTEGTAAPKCWHKMPPPNPKGGRNLPERRADFSRTLGGKLPERRAENCPNEGRKIARTKGGKINGLLGGFYLFARRKF